MLSDSFTDFFPLIFHTIFNSISTFVFFMWLISKLANNERGKQGYSRAGGGPQNAPKALHGK
jgi:hypothetical protein